MDIKQEPEQITNLHTENEFAMGLGNIKNENYICDEKNTENIYWTKIGKHKAYDFSFDGDRFTSQGVQWRNYKKDFDDSEFKMKIEDYDSESSINKMSPVCRLSAVQGAVSSFEIQINDMDLKSELGSSNKELNIDSPKFSNYHDLQPDMSFPGSVPQIRLNRTSFYRRNFVCNVCYIIFPTAVEQEHHKLVHKKDHNETGESIKEKTFKCKDCGYACRHLSKLKIHQMIHSEEKHYKCDVCNHTCNNSSNMKLHKMIHLEKKPFKCEACDYSCIYSKQIRVHEMVHSGEKPFQCDQCGFSCRIFFDMKKHKMIHSGEKPFKCEECDYRCIHSGDMKKHKMIHSGDKPFKCEQCDYSCIYSSNMKRHKMTHSGVKPFICKDCDYSCIRSSHMKRHKLIHSGNKPFKCEECDYSCIQSNNMKRHKMIHSK